MKGIVRLTLFKIPDPSLVKKAVNMYSILSQQALKDGKPYIKQAMANSTHDDPRNQGHTLVARTVFDSKDDMDYYDNDCAAHGEIKSALKGGVGGPPLVVYMDE